MKLVGYARVSTKTQWDNSSISEQVRRIQSYCDAFNHELVGLFTEVGSGKDMDNRPKFNEAMQMVKTEADGIIAIKLDRIARNCRDVLTLVEDVLQPKHKALVLLDLNIDTSSPTGMMILTVMAAVAELERKQINERTQGGRRAKAENGGYAYGSPAFGLEAVDGELVANDNEQKAIEVIRRHRKSGKSYQRVAEYLNEANIPTKRGKEWSAMQVKRICDRLKKSAA